MGGDGGREWEGVMGGSGRGWRVGRDGGEGGNS